MSNGCGKRERNPAGSKAVLHGVMVEEMERKRRIKETGERRNRQFIPEAKGGHQHDLRVSGSEDERTVARVKT